MNNDLRSSLDILNLELDRRSIVLCEGDFVGGSTELTDDQVKQIFMILSQAAVYKKIQGSLKGYTPTFKVDTVANETPSDSAPIDGALSSLGEDIINENIFSKMKDAFVNQFGSKGDKMAMVAKNTSENVLKQWEADSISGGIPSTVEGLGTWIKNKNVPGDIIDTAFKSIGVPNIENTIGSFEPEPEPEPTPEVEPSEVEQWLEDEILLPTAFTGAFAKEFLLDKGVSDERADTMLNRIGVKSGKIVSKDQYGKLDTIVQKFGGGKISPREEAPNTNWPAAKVHNYILNKYEIDQDHLDIAFDSLGLDMESDAPIGDNALRKLTNAIKDQVPEKGAVTSPEPDAVMDNTQKIMKDAGGSVSKSVQAGKKAAASNDFTSMSELQKLGIAILTARKKL